MLKKQLVLLVLVASLLLAPSVFALPVDDAYLGYLNDLFNRLLETVGSITGYATSSCTTHAQCSQACTTLCPYNVYGCCYGCSLGQCVSGTCQCTNQVSYCSSSPPFQKGSSCLATSSCTTHAQCSQACTTLCPYNVYGCCYGCSLGQCVSGTCQCTNQVSYCSSSPPFQKGSSCLATGSTIATTTTSKSCSDTDSGNYPLIAGTCTDTSSHQDTCSGRTLTEYHCSDGSCVSATKNCADYDCTTGLRDYCTVSSSNLVREGDRYICSGETGGALPHYCRLFGDVACQTLYTCGSGNECSSSSCLGTTYKCYYSNAGSYTWATTPPAETACSDGHDNDCDGKADCGDNDCSNNPSCTTPTSPCSDTDSGNYPLTAGTCTDTSSHQDTCVGMQSQLTEYYCSGSSCTSTVKSCIDYDCTTGLDNYCTVSSSNLVRKGDHYACSGDAGGTLPHYCRLFGDTVCQTLYTCGSASECSSQSCLGTSYKCYYSNAGSYTWATTPPAETACSDGHDNDCDGKADCGDNDCSNNPSCTTTTSSTTITVPTSVTTSSTTSTTSSTSTTSTTSTTVPRTTSTSTSSTSTSTTTISSSQYDCKGGNQRVGDCNNDGQITDADATIVSNILTGNIPSPSEICCADVNNDGAITAADSMLIAQYAAGNKNCFTRGYSCLEKENCTDGVDNDCDDLIDSYDSDCGPEMSISSFSCKSIGSLKAQCTVGFNNLDANKKYYVYVAGNGKGNENPAAGATVLSGSDASATVIVLTLKADTYQLGAWLFEGSSPDVIKSALTFWKEDPVEVATSS